MSVVGVSRETQELLTIYGDLVRKWTRRINLVSRSDKDNVVTRHIADSKQLYDLCSPKVSSWVDLGSGGGFPAIVVAICARHEDLTMTLIEADRRKCEFLKTVRRELGLTFDVVCDRIEDARPVRADVVSARALADLPRLLELSHRHAQPKSRYFFPKGIRYKEELEMAQQNWLFNTISHESQTNKGSVVLELTDVQHVS